MKEESQLLDRYLDGELTPDEERRLAEWLAADAEHVRQFVRETSLHRQIRETMLARPYRAYGLSEVESAEPKRWQSPIRSLARQLGQLFEFPWLPSPRWALAAAVVILCVFVLPGFLRTQGVPELASVAGGRVEILRGQQAIAAEAGLRLQASDVIRTLGATKTVITYGREATRIELKSNTELKLLASTRGKRLELREGKFDATVARQRWFRPMLVTTPQAEARVLGTEFTLTTTTNLTRLEVTEGKVRLTRTSDGARADVPAEYYAVAASGAELAALPQTGSILREIWTGIPGGEVNDLFDHPDYPNRPAHRDLLKTFETPVIQTNNYACRLIGYIHPPVTGDYTFWIASGGFSALWLNPDENPVGKVRIASAVGGLPREWAPPKPGYRYQMPQSPKIRLVAGRRYLIQAVEKAATNSSHLEVAWKIPGAEREIISGEFLSLFKPKE